MGPSQTVYFAHYFLRRIWLCGLLLLPLLIPLQPALPAHAVSPRPSRGGAAVVGSRAQPASVSDRLKLLSLGWYYDYSYRLEDEQPGTSKVGVLRGGEKNRAPLDQVAAQARAHPGHYWIVFNEPDLDGQDMVSDQFLAAQGKQRFDYYAQVYHDYAITVKQADPTAKLVAPNLFCLSGSFEPWIDAFRGAYRARFGSEPPVDVWALHLYSFDPEWRTLPAIDITYSKKLYLGFRDYVRSVPGQENAPIWVTEAGTIWGYRDLYLGPDSLFRGTDYAWPELTAYLADLIPWLEAEAVDRWFLFGTNPYADPWAGVPNALYLLDDSGHPTAAGKLLSDVALSVQVR
jgi:hypothetical protein